MKLNFFESEYGVEKCLTPETVEETAELARFALNAKAEKPSINIYFGSEVNLSVWMKKKSKSAQSNTITNKK